MTSVAEQERIGMALGERGRRPHGGHRCVAEILVLDELVDRALDEQVQRWSAERARLIDEVERTITRLADCDLTRGWCRLSGPVALRHCPTCACGDAA